MASIEWMIAQARKRIMLGIEQKPACKLPCEMVLTMDHEKFIVRCRCMAGTVSEPRNDFYGYDPIGTGANFDEIMAIWRKHVER